MALWVALAGRDAVCALDEDTGSLQKRIQLNDHMDHSILGARRVLLDAGRQRLFVALSLSNEIAVWDLQEERMLAVIPVGMYPTGLTMVGDRVLVCCSESDSIWSIDARTLTPLGCVSLPGYPVGPEPFEDTALLCGMHSGVLWRLRGDMEIVEERLLPRPAACVCAVPGDCYAAALLPAGRDRGALTILQRRVHGIPQVVQTGGLPSVVRPHPTRELVALTEMDRNEVLLWWWNENRQRRVFVRRLPDDALWSADGRRLYVSCLLDQCICVLDREGELLQVWDLPGEPRGLALG